jgi:hypothetical protein
MKLYNQIALLLWCAQPVLQAIVAFVLWHRKLYTKFPVFFRYVIAQIAIFAVTFPLRLAGSYAWFFYTYWTAAAVSALLSFKVIHEVFLDVFRPYHTLKDLGTVLFKWAGVVMLLVAVVVAFSNSTKSDPDATGSEVWSVAITMAVTSLERSVRLVQCGLILFLLLFSRFLGVSKRQQSFGVALGFGMYAAIELILLALYSGGYLGVSVMTMVNTIMYDVAILVWLSYSLSPGAVHETSSNPLQTQRWEQSLADLQTVEPEAPAQPDSLIPMFEGMVERAFSHSSNLEMQHDRAAAAKVGSKSGE